MKMYRNGEIGLTDRLSTDGKEYFDLETRIGEGMSLIDSFKNLQKYKYYEESRSRHGGKDKYGKDRYSRDRYGERDGRDRYERR